MRASQRFPLTAVGDVNTYALFAEHFCGLMNPRGKAGVLVPTGIATDDSTKDFFGDLVEKRAIVSLFDFENREAIFPSVHRSYKFCLLTFSGTPVRQTQFVFFATRVEHLRDNRRRFTLDPAEIALFNPNTRTMPVFRTRADAELTRSIYQRIPVLVNERTGENPWGIGFLRMFDMANDSGLFVTKPREGYVRLYEGKMIEQFDHRFGDFQGLTSRENTHLPNLSLEQYTDPSHITSSWYWVSEIEVRKIKQKSNIMIPNFCGYRFSTGPTNSRTMLATIIPDTATNHILPLFYSGSAIEDCNLIGLFNSLVYDYCLRQKMGRQGLDLFFVKQTPILFPKLILEKKRVIIPKLMELIFTAWDLKSFVDRVWCESSRELQYDLLKQWQENALSCLVKLNEQENSTMNEIELVEFPYPPFRWNEERRALLRAELDAFYASLYGLKRKQLRYILDPADLTPHELEDILDPWEEVGNPLDSQGYAQRVAASDFPGETFRVLKEKEIRQFGEYRTRRLVLEAWDRLEGVQIGNPDGYLEQSTTVNPNHETNSLSQSTSESHPEASLTQQSTSVKPYSPATPPAKMVKENDPPTDQLTLTDFGIYKCETCGKLVLGFDKPNHEQEKHSGKIVEWKKLK